MRQNVTAHLRSPGANVPSSLDSINRELVKWCVLRSCAWSGTPSELLVALKTTIGVLDDIWPASPRALYAHIAAHQEILRSSGIDVTVSGRCPRIVSLKPRHTASEAKSPLVVNSTNSDQADTSHAAVTQTHVDKGLVKRASSERSSKSPIFNKLSLTPSINDNVQKQITEQANKPCNEQNALTQSSSGQKEVLSPSVEGDTSSPLEKQPTRSNAGKIQSPFPAVRDPRSESSTVWSVADALSAISDLQEQIKTLAKSTGNARATGTSDRGRQVLPVAATTTTNDPGAKPNSSDQVRTPGLSVPESVVNISHSAENTLVPPMFDSAAEALLAIVEMQEQIEKRYLDPDSILKFVAERTHEICGSSSVAIGVVRHNELVYSSEAGNAGTNAELQCPFRALQSSIQTGEILQLQDSQTDPVNALTLPAGMKSLIISPFEMNGDMSGAIRVGFQERRRFQNADIITLQLIGKAVAEAIDDALSRASSMSTDHQQLATPGGNATPTADSAQPLGSETTLTGWKLFVKRHLKHS